MKGVVSVKNTMTRILMLAVAMLLALGLCFVANAEEAAETETAEAVSTTAYIFWQDSDWWPAATSKTDDYWIPVPVTITGEGYYTVSLKANMPSWFYSGGNHNTGAQKLAVVIVDGNDLFPGMYMQITDIRVDGVSYPCGDVTYGQTGYDNIMDGGVVAWDANDTYALIYDQWMIDNAGTVGTGATWNSAGVAQKFDVFDVSVLNDPSTIEIDFFLSSQQDVKPAGGPALRVLSEGPKTYAQIVKLAELSGVKTDAWLNFCDGAWWPQRQEKDQDGNGVNATDAVVTGQGTYTVGVDIASSGWHSNGANGAQRFYVMIEEGEELFPGYFIQITDIRLDGNSVEGLKNNLTASLTWDLSENKTNADTYAPIYVAGMNDVEHNIGSDRRDWGEDATCAVIDPSLIAQTGKIEVDFIYTDEAGQQPDVPIYEYDYVWYPDNTMGVAGYSLRDLGIGNKWYNVVPVDMTKDGIYKIPLVASNKRIMGNAIVTVQGNEVTVEYETITSSPGNLTIDSECVKWFASIDEITADFVNAPESELAFGEPMDKTALGNVGYLFICNRVTYCLPITDYGTYPAVYYPTSDMWVNYRAGLDQLVAELTPVVDAPDAEVVAE